MPYVDAQKVFDHDYPDGRRYYWKSLNLLTLDDAAIERSSTHARRQPSPFSTTDLWHIGGAVQRVGAAQSAFYGRHAAYPAQSRGELGRPRRRRGEHRLGAAVYRGHAAVLATAAATSTSPASRKKATR